MTTDASIVRHVTFGRQRVARDIVPRGSPGRGRHPAAAAPPVMGHGSARIARALGASEDTIQRLVRGDARTVSPPCATRSPTCTTRGGTSAPPNAPGPNAPPPPAPAAAPPPGTGAPPPP